MSKPIIELVRTKDTRQESTRMLNNQSKSENQKQSQKAGLAVEQVQISLDGDCLIDLSFAIAPGEVVTIMGPSGSGKSTLLAFLGGFLAPDFKVSGDVLLNERSVISLPPDQRQIGILFQDPLLFPHMSVGQNLGFGLNARIKGKRERQVAVCSALEDIGLKGYDDRDPATLSGGQKARVALARILLSEPQALLLDEPFSKLDADLRDQMRAMVFDRARDHGLPTLLVTHDEQDATAAGGKVIRLAKNHS